MCADLAVLLNSNGAYVLYARTRSTILDLCREHGRRLGRVVAKFHFAALRGWGDGDNTIPTQSNQVSVELDGGHSLETKHFAEPDVIDPSPEPSRFANLPESVWAASV